MKTKILSIAIILFAVANLFAANDQPENVEIDGTSITGIVKDFNINNVVEYANVILYKLPDSTMITGAITNEKGIFILKKVPFGDYYIEIDFIGYNKKIINNVSINKKNKQINFGEIELLQASENIGDVVIKAERNYIDYKIDKKIINVSQQLSASGGTAVDVLENAPSVVVDIDGNVSIRGSSSYTVLIDGKPSVMNGNDILKQIPASTIKHIEIITNPSAKYDPEGTAGIVNIILKKENRDGLNGIVNTTVATWDKFGGDATLNYRKNKLNYFVSANYNKNPFHANSINDREIFFTDTIERVLEKTKRTQTMTPWKTTLGVDYDINKNNFLNISASVGSWSMDRLFETTYETWSIPQTTENYAISENDFYLGGLYYSVNSNFQHKFKNPEHKIDFNLSIWQWNGNMNENSFEQVTDNQFNPTGAELSGRSNLDNIKNNLEAKIDYVLPTKIGNLELGANTKIIDGTSNFVFENFDYLSNQWINNSKYTNDMYFRRNIYSAYSTFGGEIYGFNYMAGIRLEYTDRLFNQKTTNEKYPLQIFNYYPSAHISRQITKTQQLQISYSRRINRPRDWQLNPFPAYSDSYNSFQGNAMLKPEDIDSYELNYINQTKKITLSIGTYYRLTKNTQTMTLDVDEANPNLIALTFDNLDKTQNFGSEFMTNYKATKWLNINWSANLYRYIIETELVGEDLNKAQNSWNTRLTANFMVAKNTKIQLTGMYNSPVLEGQGIQEEMYFMQASIKQDFLKNRLSVTLNARDIFQTGVYHVLATNSNFTSDFVFVRESPVVRLSISYKINNYQRKQRERIELGEGAN